MSADRNTAELRIAPPPQAIYALAFGVFIATWCESRLFDHHLAYATVYFSSGIILAALYSLDRPARSQMLAAAVFAQIAGYWLGGRTPGAAIVISLIVGGQSWFGATALRALVPKGLDLARPWTFAVLALVAMLVAPTSGVIFEELLVHADPALFGLSPALSIGMADTFQAHILVSWILPHALGTLLAVPLTIKFFVILRTEHAAWWSVERVAILATNFIVSTAIFYSDGHTYMFLVYPTLVLAALRLGISDTAFAVLISLLVASTATAHGHGPIMVLQPDPDHRRIFLELAYLCAYACVLPIAASLESRRRLEADLAHSLEFTEQILSNMHEIVFRTDAEARWTFLNPAWEEITGYSVAETLGRNANWLAVVDDAISSPPSVYSELVNGDVDTLNLQRQIRRRDGEILNIGVSVRAFRDDDGQFLGTTGTIRDMTEHWRYLEALEKSERRFRQLCDTAPIGIVRCDRSGTISYANHKLELIVSASLEKLIGMRWLDVLGIESPALTEHLSAALLTPGAVFEQELSFLDGTGLRRWLIFHATGEFDNDLNPTGYIAAVNDITPRKTAETALASRTAELRLLAENINDMIFRIGLDRTVRYATPSVLEVMGYDPQQLIGTKALDHVHPDEQQAVDAAFAQIAQGAVHHCTFSWRSLTAFPEAEYVWLEANCRLLLDEDGKPYEVIAAIRDINERKMLEFDIIEARHRAELATLAKSAFIANLSHEIRTPMSGVIGLTELLLGRDLDEPSRRYAKLISDSGAAMMQLLNDILDISKIDSGRLLLTSEEFDLHKCLASSLSLMTASIGNKQLDLRLDIAPDLPHMMLGDSLRLRQVLANLIGNSVKFTEAGQVVVGARIDGCCLEIRIEDTGIGIPQEQQALVFEEFVQANPEIASGYGGTGLGLSISRRISEVMGGTLTLTSESGQGTTVTLRIPARFNTAPNTAVPTIALPLEAAKIPLRVLVAEDNRTNQIIINGMLQRLGHSCAIAQNGEEVITMVQHAAVANEPFDLVLMDVQMPVMDGIEATGRLRMMGFDALRLPIIAVTANGYQEDIARCLAAGMQDHLTKPLRLAELNTVLIALGKGEHAEAERDLLLMSIKADNV